MPTLRGDGDRPAAPVLVALGGAVGASLRYGVGAALPTRPGSWPTATFLVNVLGALALGLLLETLLRAGPEDGRRRFLRLTLGTGVLGAFTTYSTLATEVVLLGRDGHAGLGVAYALASAAAGVTAAAVGVLLAQRRSARTS